ncbi:MAG: urea carboxylase-associated family protein, partial [Fimbriimonadaceae bacterium]|nr:urea carboxylase-associated family protein [Alphaproteobacteria bacterium]
MGNLVTIPARRGKAAFVGKGQAIKVINTHGEQVVD